jgi:hypothetical protein
MLQPVERLNVHRAYTLTINGQAPGGLGDAQGRLLDGNGDGHPGSDYVTQVDRHTLVFGLPGTAFVPIVPASWHVHPAAQRVHTSRSHARPSPHPVKTSGAASGTNGVPRVLGGGPSKSWSMGSGVE